MGEIYRARDSRLNRVVAIKVLPADDKADDKRRQRFLQEAQSASGLSHPNIVTVHDIMHEGGADLMVMELVTGSTLVDLVPKSGLPVHDVLKYGVQIASALAAAHAAGIVHRDIKPGNIMVTPQGLVKVLDFGLAKPTFADLAGGGDVTRSIAAPLTVQGSVLGTVNYMSPEQAEGKPLDPRSDIFSFGIVMYEMITGQTAFGRDTLVSSMTAILRDEAPPIREVVPQTPARLIEIVDRCLRKDREQRWASMEDVRRELEGLKLQYDTGSAPTMPVAPVSVKVAKAKKMPVWVLAAGVLGLAAVGAGGWWALGRRSEPPPTAQTAPASQQPPAAQPEATPAEAPLTNDAIMEMVQARVPQSVIAGHIRSSKTNFDLSTTALIQLTKAGVPAAVIEMMRNPATASAAATTPAGSVPGTAGPAGAPGVTDSPAGGLSTAPGAAPVSAAGSSAATTVVSLTDGIPVPVELAEDVPLDAPAGAVLKFRATENLMAAGAVVIAKGAAVEGRVVDETKKRALGLGSKMTFELVGAETAGGQKVKLRATPSADKGGSRRPLDAGAKKKVKDLAAPAGSEFVAYVDGAQTVSVKK